MNRIIAGILVVVYLSTLFRTYIPFAEYAFNKDYIAKVLCINKDKPALKCEGKCFLMQKLKQANLDKQQNATPSPEALEIVIIPAYMPKSAQTLFSMILAPGFTAMNPDLIYLENVLTPATPPPEDFA